MSVHRAGTLYGVPHSTLEYKVKDRMRTSRAKPVTLAASTTANAAVTGSDVEVANANDTHTLHGAHTAHA